mmetsp:Transcript_18922/g.17161  ORF Transcript_18922/g.17161 Transcript_18922/m.17161 type:complete len:128 (+) Transcript_18922:45-428(+)
MAGRNDGETTKEWLERLISSGASDAHILAVTEILKHENSLGSAGGSTGSEVPAHSSDQELLLYCYGYYSSWLWDANSYLTSWKNGETITKVQSQDLYLESSKKWQFKESLDILRSCWSKPLKILHKE